MSKFIKGDPSTPEYWNKRVKSIPNEKDMLFLDPRREEFWARVRNQLQTWTHLDVLDVACGYGQFCSQFWNYTGVDFSEEMIKLAESKYPNHKFVVGNIKNGYFGEFDVIFEVNSLHSLGWTPEQFFEKFAPHARVAVACLEADQFIIKQFYDNTKRA